MAATYRDSTIALLTGVTTIPVTMPTMVDGDVVGVLICNRDGTDATQAAPGGSTWTAYGAVTTVTGTAASDLRAQAYYRVITNAAGEPASYNWTISESENVIAFAVSLSGVDTTTPIEAHSASGNASAANALAASVTTLTNDALVVWAWWKGSGTSTSDDDAASTLREEGTVSSLTGVLATEARASSGPTGTRTATYGGSAAVSIGIGLAFKAATGGSPVTVNGGTSSAVAATAAPGVTLGAITITPGAATAVAASVAPSVALGALTVTPASATAVAATAAPSVTLGGVSVAPAAASAVAASVAPSVVLGAVSVAPAPASAVAASVAPTVQEGSPVTVTPDPAVTVAAGVAPTVVLGPITISPGAATALAGSAAPTVDVPVVVADGPFTLVAASNAYTLTAKSVRVASLVAARTRSDTLTAGAFSTSLTSNPGRRDTVYIADHDYSLEGR